MESTRGQFAMAADGSIKVCFDEGDDSEVMEEEEEWNPMASRRGVIVEVDTTPDPVECKADDSIVFLSFSIELLDLRQTFGLLIDMEISFDCV